MNRLLMVVALAVGLVGCGSSQDEQVEKLELRVEKLEEKTERLAAYAKSVHTRVDISDEISGLRGKMLDDHIRDSNEMDARILKEQDLTDERISLLTKLINLVSKKVDSDEAGKSP